jgi:hypothetical protein
MARTHAAGERIMYAVTSRNNRRGVASGVLCGSAPRLYDSTDRVHFSEWVSEWVSHWAVSEWVSSVQLSTEEWSELVDEWVRGLLRYSPCELLLLESGTWGTGIIREPRVRRTSAVGCRYQATIGEDTADWEGLVRIVVNYRECESVIAL